jgi:hypothetical protein
VTVNFYTEYFAVPWPGCQSRTSWKAETELMRIHASVVLIVLLIAQSCCRIAATVEVLRNLKAYESFLAQANPGLVAVLIAKVRYTRA